MASLVNVVLQLVKRLRSYARHLILSRLAVSLENGLITRHRVYWGLVGFNKLHNAINKARQ
jgi:hypothetical protein